MTSEDKQEREKPTCVADTCVVDLDTDLVGLGRRNLDILDGEGLSGGPGNGGLDKKNSVVILKLRESSEQLSLTIEELLTLQVMV